MENMRCVRWCGLVAVFLAAASGHLFADVILSVAPATETVAVGSLVTVALEVSGLHTGADSALGGFELEIGYNSSVLIDPTVTFGDPSLGDQLALTSPSLSCTGLNASCGLSSMPLQLYELSLDPASTLASSQASAFTLVTITFDAIAAGGSPITLEGVTLVDPFGDPLNPHGILRIENGQINSGDILVGTPEPASLLLLGSLFAFFAATGRFATKAS